ncbi:DegT/DnrJ/EryC1/StrS family aminotransferase [Nonlabens antarcticus]|uniref:DegT/DnrJ/EryC1/StrS family aminotransferase n=1 Tax=Nonlabens antarcticus TaxID=392714 RepID=UPI003743F206
MKPARIVLSPMIYEEELKLSLGAFNSNTIAEDISRFEQQCQSILNINRPILALNSGTAAIHLSLLLAGIKKGDHVLCQSMTFVASANPLLYIGAIPVFIDSEKNSWNMDPQLMEEAYQDLKGKGIHVKAIMLTSIYGMPFDYESISAFAKANQLKLIDDSAEALGSSFQNKANGTLGDYGIISFNNNKIITTSGGGLLVCPCQEQYERGLFLATQAKEKQPYYQHEEIGYNYRMGHINALLGLAQLPYLLSRIRSRRAMNAFYQELFKDIAGVTVQVEKTADYYSNHWLSAILVDPSKTGGISREDLRLALEAENIESRPLWKPMHLQPLYEKYPYYGGTVCEELFEQGLCLPSGSNLTDTDRSRIKAAVLKVFNS